MASQEFNRVLQTTIAEYMLDAEDNVIRIGARDLSLNDPTRPSDEIFFTIPGKAGVGLRAYTNQAVFLETPAQAVYISGIVNSLA